MLPTLCLILVIEFNACLHYRQIRANVYIDYLREFFVSAGLIGGFFLVLFLLSVSAETILTLATSVLPLRWIFHDLTLNLLRGLRWDYLGTRSSADRFSRAFWERTGIHPIWLKWLLLIALVAAVSAFGTWTLD